MKKIFTSILLLLPFLTFAQGPWEFNTAANTESWVGATTQVNSATASTTTVSANGTSLVVQTQATSTGRNPNINRPTAGIILANFNRLSISLKNNSLNASSTSYIRFWVSVDGGTLNGTIVPGIVITAEDATFKTYEANLSGVVGTAITQIYFEFKVNNSTAAGANYTPTAPAPTIEIDYIRPSNAVVPTQNTFTFNATTEGFTTLTRATAVQATESTFGTLRMTSNTVSTLDSRVGLASSFAKVDGTTNKYAHITLKNTSTNTRFLISGSNGNNFPIQPFTTNDAGYKTYDFDLSLWTGNQQPELVFGVQTTWIASPQTYTVNQDVIFQNSTYRNTTGTNTASNPKLDPTNWALQGTEGALLDLVNSIYIDNIVFDNTSPVLSLRDIFSPSKAVKKKVTTISLYPNPTKETLNVEAKYAVNKIEIFNVSGQMVLQNQSSNKIDVVSLNNGVYFVKVTQRYGDPEFLKFIKD